MKKALIQKSTNRILSVVGPEDPNHPGQMIDENTAFQLGTPDARWVDCGDAVTMATHTFDGERFLPKPARA